ncbi:MAG: ribonuclease H-like domain-containing protein [Saprospiraceae bacterium]|nr:ribonuclease H-like domain-containing protein [Saprospiraceae bacterium]
MLERIDITKILFLDVECVSGVPSFDQLSDPLQELWRNKSRQVLRLPAEEMTDELVASSYQDRAGIFAEFGKIVCISVGLVYWDKDKQPMVRLKSFANDDEKALLSEFSLMLNQYYPNPNEHYICGHNIKEFDVPYICRRMVVHSLPFPSILQIAGKKPWETKHLLDTMDYWKFGDRKNFTSLKLLAAILGFPSPKDDIDGSEVGRVYWEEENLNRIALYCEKDVLATIQLFRRYQRNPVLSEDQYIHVDDRS